MFLLPYCIIRFSYTVEEQSGFCDECKCAMTSSNFIPFGAECPGNCFDRKKFVVLKIDYWRKVCCCFAQYFCAIM